MTGHVARIGIPLNPEPIVAERIQRRHVVN